MQQKSDIRKAFLTSRSQINSEQRQIAANKATQILLAHSLFKNIQHIACYLAQENEFDSTPLIHAVLAAKKNCYLPRLINAEKKIEFAVYHFGDPLSLNRYQILEPHSQPFPIEKLDIVLVPLVAFDEEGNRLGRGGGYYDRTFYAQSKSKPLLLGLGYEQQKFKQLPSDPWDVKLDGVLTEHRLILFNSATKIHG